MRDGRFTQMPAVGDMIFIDLFGPDGVGHGQVTHVGIVEYVEGSTVGIVQGNGKPAPSVITRTTSRQASARPCSLSVSRVYFPILLCVTRSSLRCTRSLFSTSADV